MCGIVGFIYDGKVEDGLDILNKSVNEINHRGPDYKRTIIYNKLYLGHTRLKIIDLTDASNQPFEYGESVIVSFNGEIYNYKELKVVLSKNGFYFNSEGDAEVIAAAYIYWGSKFVNYLDGMYAISILDKKLNKLFLVRDLFGKKPLYYSLFKGFSFSSELNPFKHILGDLKLNFEALNHFLAIGYVLNPGTIYANVSMLPPSSMLEYEIDSGKIHISKYFDYGNCFRIKHNSSESEILENVQELLISSVKKRLVGDVKSGLFLSSGVDSSGILSIIKQLGHNISTYTIGFDNVKYNESLIASQLANYYNVENHIINLTAIDKLNFMNFIDKSDYLTFDNSTYPIYKLSELASNYVKFVLTGDGSDEVFSGYTTYKADKINQSMSALISIIKKFGLNIKLNSIIPITNNKIDLFAKSRRFFKGMDNNSRLAHYNWRLIFDQKQRVELLGNEYRELVYETDPFKKFDHYYSEVSDLELTDQHLYVDTMTWLTDNNMIKLDRATMLNGLEARCPFLDRNLVSYVAGCPTSLKRDKYLLKKILTNLIPQEYLHKPKRGFNSPVGMWFNTKEDEFEYYTKLLFYKKYNKIKNEFAFC